MELEFHGNHVFSKFTVIGNTQLVFTSLVDTGSSKTGIPLSACQNLGLKLSGTERTEGLYGTDFLPLFDAELIPFGCPELIFDIQILGLPIELPLVGIDILKRCKISIDWVSQPRVAKADCLMA